jgi:hypothetical protein
MKNSLHHPRNLRSWGRVSVVSAIAMLGISAGRAWALPSYAQQTGAACTQCHTIGFGPQLTAYGRQFKLNGYVWGDAKGAIPLALMTVVGYNHTAKAQPEAPAPHYSPNDNFAMNELTGFYAGRITKNVGAFIEAAYSGIERHTAWGAFDVRYAHATTIGGKGVVYGVSINNNPTVTDLWNSTPVWSFPYTGSDLSPAPSASPALSGGISERVLGPALYMMINDRLYLEVGAYHGMSDRWLSNVGLTADDNLHLDGLATYWRAVLQFDQGPSYYSIGLVGLNVKQQPDPAAPETDRYKDIGFDATYQYTPGGNLAATANLSLIHEKRNLDASFAAGESASNSNNLNTLHLDATLAYQRTWIGSLGFFNTTGSTNAGLFPEEELSGSANGSPDSRGYVVQLEYVPFGKINSYARPWVNVRLGLQYTGYQRFNGGSSNYDGFGRSASDNNTLFGFAWLAF